MVVTMNILLFMILAFTYLVNTENNDGTHDVIDIIRSAKTTLAIQARVNLNSATKSILWFQVKIIAFHSIMISHYLAFRMWDWTKNLITTVILGLLHPIIPHVNPLTYWITIFLSITCHGIIDTIRIVAWTLKNTNKSKVNNKISHDYPIMWIQKYTMSQPLPQNWMVLSGVNLKQEFVGWLSKVGINFTGIVDSLHRVGTNGILWSMLAQAENMIVIQD